MSDQEKRDELMEALRSRSPGDLAELCAELMLSYGVQVKSAGSDQKAGLPIPADVRELGFVQFIQWMKQNLFLAELEQFRVRDGVVEVRIDNDWKGLETSASPNRPPAADQQSGRTPAPAANSEGTPAPSTAAERPAADEKVSSDRFSMLELD